MRSFLKISTAVFSAVIVAFALRAPSASTQVAAPLPENGVCFYEFPNYQGRYFCMTVGDNDDNLRINRSEWNERISSIRVFGNARALIYQDDGYRGDYLQVTSNLADLRRLPLGNSDWDNQVTSIRVLPYEDAGRQRPSGQELDTPSDGACFYELPNYQGRSFCLFMGEEKFDLSRMPADWNERISSVKVFGQARVVVFQNAGFGGTALNLTANVPNLSSVRLGRGDWNDQISAIRVTSLSGNVPLPRPGENPPPRDEGDVRVPPRDPAPRPETDIACFFEEPNYRGRSFCLRLHQSERDLMGLTEPMGNRISSVKVIGDVRAVLHQLADFSGESLSIASDIPNLAAYRMRNKTWDNVASSVRVLPARDTVFSPAEFHDDGVCFYEDANFQGRAICIADGGRQTDLSKVLNNWAGRISSVKIVGQSQAVVFADADFKGALLTITRDITDLSHYRLLRRTWDNQITSLRVND